MSSLVPGQLFETSGLNRLYTPTEVGLTAGEISRKFAREPFNSHPWPRSSPVSRVYDVVNTPTKLILLNNKKTRKYSHLRGHSAFEADRIPVPDPERHFSAPVSPVNKDLHIECKNFKSPRFTPTPTGMEWNNQSARPPSTFSNGSLVNPRHHHSCIGRSDPANYHQGTPAIPPSAKSPGLKRGPPPSYLQFHLDDSGLTRGQRSYLWSIARIYSSDNIRRQKEKQYFELLRGEIRKGGQNSEIFYRYARYLDSPRKTCCWKDERLKRSKSAPPRQTGSTPRLRRGCHNNARRSQDHVKTRNSEPESKCSQSKRRDDSSDISSDQSGSSLTIDMCGYRPREGTVRPKSRIGRTANQSASKKSSSKEQAALLEEDTAERKCEPHDVTENSKTGTKTPNLEDSLENGKDLDAKPIRNVEQEASLETETDTKKSVTVSRNRKDHVSSRKASESSTDLCTDLDNHSNKENFGSHGNKYSIESETLSAKENKSLSGSCGSLVKENTTKVHEVSRMGSSENGSLKSNKHTTVPSRRSSSGTSSGSSRTSPISRKGSGDVVSRTPPVVGNQGNQATVEREKITHNESKKEKLLITDGRADEETSVNTEEKTENIISDDKGHSQNSNHSSAQEDIVENCQTESSQSKGTTVHVNGNDQIHNSQIAETASTQASKKDVEEDIVLGDKESWDPLLGRISPIPSIGSDDLEPVDPELLEY